MTLPITGIGHIALRVTDLEQAKKFYGEMLEFELLLQVSGCLVFNAYGVRLAFMGDAPQTLAGDRFNPFRIGLDHIALMVPEEDNLMELKQRLDSVHIPNNGIQENTLGARYISFYDSDGIAWEFYYLSPR